MREYESQTDEASGDLSLYQSDAPLDQFGRNTPFAEDIAPEPSLRFSRATWWDCLLQTYDIHQYDPDPTSRQSSALEISRDVFKFFKVASYWLSFIHVPLFFDMFHHPEYRTSIQPALILAILSYSKLLQSTRENPDEAERERMWQQSVNLRDLAQASFDASYNAGWIDLQLAQAAWILVFYETCGHRDSSITRKESTFFLLVNVIRYLNLTNIDAMDPRVPRFAPHSAPALGRPPPNGQRRLLQPSPIMSCSAPSQPSPLLRTPPSAALKLTMSPVTVGCPCLALSLASTPETSRCTPEWGIVPRWGSNRTWADIRKEEARRLVWSSVFLLSGDALARLVSGTRQLDLHINRPENYALLYPGEEAYASIPEVDAVYPSKE
ncbi:hypothetical protein FRB97_003306 [Tulasnella sp. 331]|nr:hypothetical protein FRB97_003306 [Tulasnella sp. 331]